MSCFKNITKANRLKEQKKGQNPWRKCEPYLPERKWETVGEDYSADSQAWDYFSHDHTRSRVYRWREEKRRPNTRVEHANDISYLITEHLNFETCRLYSEEKQDRKSQLLFAKKETNKERIFGANSNDTENVKDGNKQSSGHSPEVFNRDTFFFCLKENLRFSNFPPQPRGKSAGNSLINDFIITGKETANPNQQGTKSAVRYRLVISFGEAKTVRLQLTENEKIQSDPHFQNHLLFHEYFYGNTGKRLDASHQTGWAALVAKLIQQSQTESIVSDITYTEETKNDKT